MIRSRLLIATLATLLALAGFLVGSRHSAPDPTSAADVEFLQSMIHHHEQAVVMATAELVDGRNHRLLAIAREILFVQGYEIGLMERTLADWGHRRGDPLHVSGMATPAELRALDDAAGNRVDELFVRLMVAHHEGGIAMATRARSRARDSFVRDLAAGMVHKQSREVLDLHDALRRRAVTFNPPSRAEDMPASGH